MEPDWSDYVRHARRLAEQDPENRNGHMVSVPAWMLVAQADVLGTLLADQGYSPDARLEE